MDLRSLKYFVSVYETGSFSAASKQQYIAQPSISAAIKQLEASLAKPLFVRYPRGVKPTEAGHQLYPLARQMLGQAMAIKDLFRDDNSRQPFRLGLIKGLGVARMSALLKKFTARIEALELTLVPPEDVADARIVSRELLRPQETFITIWRDRYQLALPMDHPLALKDRISLEDLHQLAFIQRSPCEGWSLLETKLRALGLAPDIRARIRTIEYALGLVRAGVGCAFVPIFAHLEENAGSHPDVVCRELDEVRLNREIGLAYEHRTPIIDILRKLVRHA